MKVNALKPVTPDEIRLVQSVLDRLLAGAPIATNSDATTWLAELEAGSSDVVEVAIAAKRLRLSRDTVKRCAQADPSIGGKIAGRWHVSIRRLQRYRSGA